MIFIFGLFVFCINFIKISQYYKKYGEDFIYHIPLEEIQKLQFNGMISISCILIGMLPGIP
jgi:hypothetical protein